MTLGPQETTAIHPRLLKCALAIPESRAYWLHTDGTTRVSAAQAFHEYWFGARSLAWIQELLSNMRARFDAFPTALAVLHRWPHMSPDTRRTLCHWHLQLSDPLYRAFTAEFLLHRRDTAQATVTRDLTVAWIAQQTGDRWTVPTRIQLARKLISAAHSAGLVAATRKVCPLVFPYVPDEAIAYLFYLLRDTHFAGTLVDNPYLSSLGLDAAALNQRHRRLPGLVIYRQGTLVDIQWHSPNLLAWADRVVTPSEQHIGGAP